MFKSWLFTDIYAFTRHSMWQDRMLIVALPCMKVMTLGTPQTLLVPVVKLSGTRCETE